MSYRYDPSRTALFTPAKGVDFFAAGRPASEAALCAEMSRLVYVPFERGTDAERRRLTEALTRIGFTPPHLFSGGGTQAFLTNDTDRAVSVLAFRGTEVNPGDWATVLAAWRVPWSKGGKVHRGFARAFASVWRELAPQLDAAPGRLLYTGHSLGGALATLAASRHPPQALYTFGSPRVGNRAFVKSLPSCECHRFTNCCDFISRLPLRFLGYRHCGPTSYLDREGAVHVGPNAGVPRWDRARARIAYLRQWSWRSWTLATRDFADHSPANYVSALTPLR